jgi:hypothetical protein
MRPMRDAMKDMAKSELSWRAEATAESAMKQAVGRQP